MNETFEQFCERMSQLEKKAEYQVGMRHAGHSRAVFEFEGQSWWLESCGYRRLPTSHRGMATPAQMFYVAMGNPVDWWMHSKLLHRRGRCERIQKHYGAMGMEENYYPPEGQEGKWFSLKFDTFEALMKMVWDIRSGEFVRLFGEEPYELLEPKEEAVA